MERTSVSRQEFEAEQNKLMNFYPYYKLRFADHLWYAEDYFGSDLEHLLKLPVKLEERYWSKDEEIIKRIRKNVIDHINGSKTKKSELRLIPSDREDREWREQNKEFFNFVLDRYGIQVEEYKIDQTVSVVGIDDHFHVQRSCYLDQFGSNIFCDQPGHDKQTLRELDTREGRLPPFEESKMANTIGVAALFFDKDGVPIFRWRKKEAAVGRMAVMREGWHCTASGVLTWQDFTSAGTEKVSLSSVIAGIEREAANEAGVFSTERGKLFEIKVIAFARELKRAGKPQFFFAMHFPHHTAEEIRDLILTRHRTESEEYGRATPRWIKPKAGNKKEDFHIDRTLSLKTLRDADLLGRSDFVGFTFEGYANLYYALRSRDACG